MLRIKRNKYTEEHIEFLRKHYRHYTNKELSDKFNKEFNMRTISNVIAHLKSKNNFPNFRVGKYNKPEMIEFVRKLSEQKISLSDIRDKFEEEFGLEISRNTIWRMRTRHNMNVENTDRSYTDEHIEYLRKISDGRLNKEITEMFNKKFNDDRTDLAIRSIRSRHGIMNNICTTWKKGIKPINYREVGAEKKLPDGYTVIKVADPDIWRLKQRHIWEKHYGKLKNDEVVLFLDNDKTNFEIENLYKITRFELLKMNHSKYHTEIPELTKAGIATVKIKNRLEEMDNEEDN